MVDSDIKNRIASFIKRKIGVEVDDSTILFGDLELIGPDADFFMKEFSQEFKVGVKNLEFDDYFVDESSIPFHYWYLKYFHSKKLKRKEFKIDHLVEVVKEGKWFDPK